MKKVLFGLIISVIFFLGCVQIPEVPKIEIIKIGVITPLTSDAAVYGVPIKNAVELAANEINAQGGIDNKLVKLIEVDSKCNVETTTKAVEKLISNDVIALIGEVCSSATLAAASIATENKVPIISAASKTPELSKYQDYVFRTIVSESLQAIEGADLVNELGYKKAAVLNINNIYGTGLADVFVGKFKELGGEILAIETFEQGSTNFSTQLTKIKDENPKAIYLIAYSAEGAEILKQVKEFGLDVQVIGTGDIKDESVLDAAGETAEGLILTSLKQNLDENYQNFNQAYMENYNKEPGLFAAEAYDALKVLALAIEKSDLTEESINNELHKIKDYKGASGIISFDENGDVVKPYSTFKVIDGEFVEKEREIPIEEEVEEIIKEEEVIEEEITIEEEISKEEIEEKIKEIEILEEEAPEEIIEEMVEEEPIEEKELIEEVVKTFKITAKRYRFDPVRIEVNKGDNVKLIITSVDVAHGFYLPEFGVNERLEPGQPVTVEFIADKEGEFTFSCNMPCGSGHIYMRGTLIVK